MKKEMSKMTMTMLCVVLFAPLKVGAQDKVKISAGADAVSTYYWRGTKLGGFSIQPSLTASIGNFSGSSDKSCDFIIMQIEKS